MPSDSKTTPSTAWNCPYWKCREDGVCHGVTYGGCRDKTTATCETHGHIWGALGKCVMCGLLSPAPTRKKHHITVVVGRHTLLALARGEEVHLNEVDASAVVTLIPESFFPSTAILEALESHD